MFNHWNIEYVCLLEGALYMLPVICQNIWQKKSFSHSNYFQDVRAFHRRMGKRQQWDQIVLLLKGRIRYYNPFMWLSNENRLVSACKAVLKLNIVVGKWGKQAKRETTNLTFVLKKSQILFWNPFNLFVKCFLQYLLF